METINKLKQAIHIEVPLTRQMSVAAIIATELEKKGTQVVVVGGSAVEFYTYGNYLTRDIDFVANRADDIKGVMSGLGFNNDGGTWYLPEHRDIIVEFPPGPLDGSWDKAIIVTMPNGDAVKVIGIEDIIIDRSCAAKNWQDKSEEWVTAMMIIAYGQIDWQYLYSKAAYELCTDVVESCRSLAQREIRIMNVEEFANSTAAQGTAKYDYLAEAWNIRNETGTWPGVEADKQIVAALVQKGYTRAEISQVIFENSPELVYTDSAQGLNAARKFVKDVAGVKRRSTKKK